MSRSKNKLSKKKIKKLNKNNEPLNSINLLILFIIGLFLTFLSFVKGEFLWSFLHQILLGSFGVTSLFIGPVFIAISIFYTFKPNKKLYKKNIFELLIFLLIICSLLQTYDSTNLNNNLSLFQKLQKIKIIWQIGLTGEGGGAVGELVSLIFKVCFGQQATLLIFWVLFIVMFFICSKFDFLKITQFLIGSMKNSGLNLKKEPSKTENLDKNSNNVPQLNVDIDLDKLNKEINDRKLIKNNKTYSDELDNLIVLNDEEDKNKLELDFKQNSIENKQLQNFNNSSENSYNFPPVTLLNQPESNKNIDVSNELKNNATILVDTLKSFGVETRITNISRGPSVTRYELQPSAGVKISKITNLADDISLNLASGGVRIEAPIPNKAAVGIEVENKIKETVFLREIVSSKEFINSKSFLTVALGKDIAGNVIIADLAKMPHILIAGATGSGKSVCVNSLIVSLIYKSSPFDVKLLLIDPKVVELGVYNGIAHLLIPVVTNPKKAAGALNWAVNEMLKRYKIFADVGVRDLSGYNAFISSNKNLEVEGEVRQKLPQIVIIIDELSDLMMAASKEVENSICRLAQMARAAGMHLVIATQRPSVDVITGLIKANVPSRIAFTVSSQIDSRTIIDMSGAEKLLGKGDMLYYPVSEQKPIRVQGCFLSDSEIERVVNKIKVDEKNSVNGYNEEILEEINNHVAKNEKKDEFNQTQTNSFDSMFFEAVEIVLETNKASTSFLQRKLKVGYSRAARIIDEMESAGIVSSADGSKSRKILITRQQFLEMNLNKGD